MAKHIFKILRLPEKIAKDKYIHFAIGAILMALMFIVTTSLYILLGSLLIVAYGIEYGQKWTKSGHFDHWDAITVILGGLTVLVPYLIKV